MTQGTKLSGLNAKTEFDLAQAALCGSNADNSVLANVRDRLRSAEAAWTDMAKLSVAQVASHKKDVADRLALDEADDLPAHRP